MTKKIIFIQATLLISMALAVVTSCFAFATPGDSVVGSAPVDLPPNKPYPANITHPRNPQVAPPNTTERPVYERK